MFTRQFSTLVKSGVPISDSLEALGDSEFKTLTVVIDDIADKIHNGWGLAKAMASFPRVFGRVYVGMVRIAEQTGGLNSVLDSLANWMESDLHVVRKAKAVMTYPLIVLGVTTVLTLGLFINIMPGFVTIFEGMNVQLPWITRILIFITNILTSTWGWTSIILMAFSIVQLSRTFLQTEKGRLRTFGVILSLPVIGPTLRTLTLGRYCAAAALMLPSGSSLLSVAKLSAIASGSPVLVHDSKELIQALSEGELLAEYMSRKPHIYPPSLAQVVNVGETTSRLDYILDKFAGLYEEEVETRLENLANFLEPVMLCGAALLVGTILVGVFLPLYGFLGKL